MRRLRELAYLNRGVKLTLEDQRPGKKGRQDEFCFEGGRLMEIQHYAMERIDIMGWGADALYVNTVTGEEFYQEY